MSDLPPIQPLERNPVTYARHRQEVLWQITIPVLAGVILLLALGILAAVLGTANDQSQWADISLIWLIAPTLFMVLILLIITAGIAYGVMRLIDVLPFYTRRLQDFFILLTVRISRLDDKAVEPVLRLKTYRASLSSLGQQVNRAGDILRKIFEKGEI
ncbi:MAG: hypothetical protein JXB15_06485 [Anaerolineales bacterium]|nr:hypothetical protein [Anaerolineales bacterium]